MTDTEKQQPKKATPSSSNNTKDNSTDYEIGDLLIHYLQQLGVEYIFGIPGGAIEPLYNALARSERRGGPKAIISRHETGAAFMADGYTSQTGKLGVCCATTGPGATNLITGVASAYANRVPMLVITAQTSLATFGKDAFQESSCTGINIVGMMSYCTRYNTLVSHADQFEQKLYTAIMHAFGPTPGPVHLSVPLDVMRSRINRIRPRFNLDALKPNKPTFDPVALEKLVDILKEDTKPVFVIGEGAVDALGEILGLAHLLDAVILTTPHGKGLINPHHPQFAGIIGFAGHASATEVLLDPERQTTLCIGTSLGEWATNGWDARLLLNNRLVHVDDQWEHFKQTPMARLHMHGDLQQVFAELVLHIGAGATPANPVSSYQYQFQLENESAFTSTEVPIKPQRLMRELVHLFPPHTRYLADTGASFAWAIHYLHPFDRRISGCRNRRGIFFGASLEFSSMGWAIGCAIGTALGSPEQPVVCITGDGSLLMSGQEITVAVQHQLAIIFVVLNDSSLGMVKHGQRLSGAESIGTAMPFTDFAKMAEAMGAKGICIESAGDLKQLNINKLCSRPGPTLLDVRIDVDEVPPIGTRIAVLKDTRVPPKATQQTTKEPTSTSSSTTSNKTSNITATTTTPESSPAQTLSSEPETPASPLTTKNKDKTHVN
ncbi:biosynthetic-type acetolactate synthase large subunit [Maricurvus nonylphenolicus]